MANLANMGPNTDFSGFFTGVGEGVERWGENRRKKNMWEALINAQKEAEKAATQQIRKQGSLTDAEYNLMVEDFIRLDDVHRQGGQLTPEEQKQHAYYNQVGMTRDKIGERGVLQNIWGAVAGDKDVGRLGSLKSLVGLGEEPDTAVMNNDELVNYFRKLKDLENYQQSGQMTPEMEQRYADVLAQKKKEHIIPALGKISPEVALRESGYLVDKPSSTVDDEEYKKNRNRLENDRVVLGRLTDAMSTAYNTYKDSVGTTEEQKRLAEYNDSKTRVDEARQRFMDTYNMMYPSDITPDIGGDTGGSDSSKNGIGTGTGTKSDPEQRTALANLKNTGFSKVANPDELANLLTSNGIVNPTLVDDARKAWDLTPEGKSYGAMTGAAAAERKAWKTLQEGELLKLKNSVIDINTLGKILADGERALSNASDTYSQKAIANDIAQTIAKIYQPTGILTDSDIARASSQGNLVTLLKNKLGIIVTDVPGINASVNVMKSRIVRDIEALQQKADALIENHNTNYKTNRSYSVGKANLSGFDGGTVNKNTTTNATVPAKPQIETPSKYKDAPIGGF